MRCNDAHEVDCEEMHHSIGHYEFILDGTSITWLSKKQLLIYVLSTNIEYTALAATPREIMAL